MICQIETVDTVKSISIYVPGAKNSKIQKIRFLSSNDMFLDMRVVEQASGETATKDAQKILAREIKGELEGRISSASRRIKNPNPYTGYISFAPKDRKKLEELAAKKWPHEEKTEQMRLMLVEIVQEYLKQMGWEDTQNVFIQHLGTNMIHIHFIISSVDRNGKAIDNHNSRKRSDTALAVIEYKFGLEEVHKAAAVKLGRKRGVLTDEQAKDMYKEIQHYHDDDYKPDESLQDERLQKISEAKKTIWYNLHLCPNFNVFKKRLNNVGIGVEISKKHKREGLVFTINGEPIPGMELGRQFTYGAINEILHYNSEHVTIQVNNGKNHLMLRDADRKYISLLPLDGNTMPIFFVGADAMKYKIKFTRKGTFRMEATGEKMKRAQQLPTELHISSSSTSSEHIGNISIPVAGHTQRSNVDASKNKGEIDYGEKKHEVSI